MYHRMWGNVMKFELGLIQFYKKQKLLQECSQFANDLQNMVSHEKLQSIKVHGKQRTWKEN